MVPPAIEAILNDPDQHIDGIIAAGHVCTVMGTSEYGPIAKKYQVPIVVTGFEPVDLLKGLGRTVEMLESDTVGVENEYRRVVQDEGNITAQKLIDEVFESGSINWRGIGAIPDSGKIIKPAYTNFDAIKKFGIQEVESSFNSPCIAGEILKGLKKPFDCPAFGKECTPENPLGAPMVSSEGSCSAYYQHYGTPQTENV
jgi:hydrogenase expression/formation protein HypD